jgi:hypothetical protein
VSPPTSFQPGYSTYRGNAGTMAYDPSQGTMTGATNGMLYVNSQTHFRDVSDGTTTTILLGETFLGGWSDGESCCVGIATEADRIAAGEPIVGDPYTGSHWVAQGSGHHRFSFGSQHGDVLNFAMVDGGCRSVSKTIDKSILAALATRNGRENITQQDY